jgi:hypothetical protein
MKKIHHHLILVSGLSIAASLLGACSSRPSASAKSELQAREAEIRSLPYVEAYIEYVGTAERWAGPASFMVHVIAKDLSIPEIALRPDLFAATAPATDGKASQFTGSMARERLTLFASELEKPDASDRIIAGGACLSPIRVRLIRADGSILDRQGCRGQGAWPAFASHTVSTLIRQQARNIASAGTGTSH